MKQFLIRVIPLLMLAVAFDHGMMLMQQVECSRGDYMACPDRLWIWEKW